MQLISAKSLRALMLVILVALVGSGVLVYGQGTSGSLTGQVSDPTGAAVAQRYGHAQKRRYRFSSDGNFR